MTSKYPCSYKNKKLSKIIFKTYARMTTVGWTEDEGAPRTPGNWDWVI